MIKDFEVFGIEFASLFKDAQAVQHQEVMSLSQNGLYTNFTFTFTFYFYLVLPPLFSHVLSPLLLLALSHGDHDDDDDDDDDDDFLSFLPYLTLANNVKVKTKGHAKAEEEGRAHIIHLGLMMMSIH